MITRSHLPLLEKALAKLDTTTNRRPSRIVINKQDKILLYITKSNGITKLIIRDTIAEAIKYIEIAYKSRTRSLKL